VYPERVPLASDVRPAQLVAVPGGNLAAVSGQTLDGAALQLIDIERAAVVWTDTRWCNGALVHATADRLLCASGRGVQAVEVDGGGPAWSSPHPFRAAQGNVALLGASFVDVRTGKSVRAIDPEPPIAGKVRELCRDGDAFAWAASGSLWRVSPALEVRWTAQLARAPSRVDVCADPVVVEVPAPGVAERTLRAFDRETGAPAGEPVTGVLGWWADGDRIVVTDASGIHTRTRALADPKPVAPAQVAGRLLVERDGVRVVRAVAGTLLVVDDRGIRAWLAAPAGPKLAVLGAGRLLAGGRVDGASAADTLALYAIPEQRMAWPARRLQQRPPADDAGAAPTPLPAPTAPGDAQVVAYTDREVSGVPAIAVAGDRVYAAAVDRRPSPKHGTAVAAFDLRTRAWLWYRADACPLDATVVALAVAGDTVVCAARHNDPGLGALAGIDAATGEPTWTRELRTIDALYAAGDRFVAVSGATAHVLDAASGEVRETIESDTGASPRVAAFAGGLARVAAGGAIVGPSWRVQSREYVVGVYASGSRVLANLAGGSLFALDASTGRAAEVAGWSASWDVAVAGDWFFDRPSAPDGIAVVRGYGPGRAAPLRVAAPGAIKIITARAGAEAPVLLLADHEHKGYVLEIDPKSRAVSAVHPWPARAVGEVGFSAAVDGAPVAGAVLYQPLAVHLFPTARRE
jgi:hypothetical protein